MTGQCMWWKRCGVREDLLEIIVPGQEEEILKTKWWCLWAHASVNLKNLHPHTMVITFPSLHVWSQSHSWYDCNYCVFSLIIYSVDLGLYLYLHWSSPEAAYLFALCTGSPPCTAATEVFNILQPDAIGKSNADFWFTLKHSLLKPRLLIC